MKYSRLRIACKSGESFPSASLKFYINDEIANNRNVRIGKSNSFNKGK